ncbi:LysE family translocator [Leucobacter sp. UCMA 4100]|uniref:LysE family translocator n=1 Tax=Leucobacter sp. UCMA 4100 TaxID=2810534 RepID=UPI0022EB62B1|nr:LysE family translocator [Leucobacter sp. UCMA 4100]MDA3145961.1 LysE family translocator [Leucobacter sp. UCMA 4100]
MTVETLLALAVYAFVTSITPGPNNLMLLSSGMTHGIARTLPHLAGITIGFGVMVWAVGVGLAGVFIAFPPAYSIVKILGAVYLVWLAVKIARSGAPAEGRAGAKPLSFLGAAAFQWVNPKTWVMAVGAIANFAPGEPSIARITLIALVYAAVNAPCVSVWAMFGALLRRWFSSPRALRAINVGMSILLLVSLVPMLGASI